MSRLSISTRESELIFKYSKAVGTGGGGGGGGKEGGGGGEGIEGEAEHPVESQ
jgi:hypothetical protein